jgi:hypothetical protein
MSGCVSNFQRLLFNSNPNKSGIEIESKKPGRSEREREGGRENRFSKIVPFCITSEDLESLKQQQQDSYKSSTEDIMRTTRS